MITIVMPYYENGGMLERHFAEWSSYDPLTQAKIQAIVIDDGSQKDPAGNHVPDKLPIWFTLYRIKQNLVWNVPGARNLGMHVAPEGWCLITDIDHLLKAADAKNLLSYGFFQSHYYYTLKRQWADGRELHPHPNSFVLERSLYWDIGGYDEDWTGWWGAGEQVFRKTLRSKAKGFGISSVPLTHFGRDDIPDASTREWGRRGSEYDWRKNPALVAKAARAPYKPERPLRFEWERVL